MQENIIDLENSIDITSATCLTTCKICDKTLSTISEYKIHIKEHRKVSKTLIVNCLHLKFFVFLFLV